jgi:hypothetical protein
VEHRNNFSVDPLLLLWLSYLITNEDMIMRFTKHADHRRIQRRLPMHILETIYEFSCAVPSKGAVNLTLDDETIELAAEDNRRRRTELERYRGAFVILSEDRVITAARRTRRHRR